MTIFIDFQTLRDQWALKAPPVGRDEMLSKLRYDQALNPHNDSYKPERRSETEIISDSAYQFADGVLTRQYGKTYETWLKEQGYEERSHGRGEHLASRLGHKVVHPAGAHADTWLSPGGLKRDV